jgi:hypothetical protein
MYNSSYRPTSYYRPAYNMTRTAKPRTPGDLFPVATVWAAACAAHRINGRYIRQDEFNYRDHVEDNPVLTATASRTIMTELLANPDCLTAQDFEQGAECQNFLQNDITFRALKNKLTEFDSATSKVLAVEENFDSAQHKYELAVIASLPASRMRALERQATDSRVRQSTGEYVGAVGDKVALDVEVIKTNYSQQWNTWYATAITSDNRAVFFAFREQLTIGNSILIKGTVKAHRTGTTQLNRVKIV